MAGRPDSDRSISRPKRASWGSTCAGLHRQATSRSWVSSGSGSRVVRRVDDIPRAVCRSTKLTCAMFSLRRGRSSSPPPCTTPADRTRSSVPIPTVRTSPVRMGRGLSRRHRAAPGPPARLDARRVPEPFEARAYVDTGPVQERVYARHAGLGWIGKNTCLISPTLGSWLFLAEILCSLPLDVDPPAFDQCGTCYAVPGSVPDEALVAPGVLDSPRCVSYLTIEHRGAIPEPLLAGMDRTSMAAMCVRKSARGTLSRRRHPIRRGSRDPCGICVR